MLEVKNLVTEYKGENGTLKAVDNLSFSLKDGESLGVVGESGCGKSTIMHSLLRLLPDNGSIKSGEILLDGNRDIAKMSFNELRSVRWKEIAFITQSAMNAFNPVYRILDQMVEVMTIQGGYTKADAEKKAEKLFELVGLEAKRLKDYPHQLSGGMRQRSMIAMALALDPKIIIADEPTTALDVVIQDRILRRIMKLQKDLNISMIFVTHDISIVAELCQRVMIMYAGKLTEIGETRVLFKKPYHPYTLGLLNAFPSVLKDMDKLISIPGYPPDLTSPPEGCRFAPRCPFKTEKCETQEPPLAEPAPGHLVSCHYIDRVDEFRLKAADAGTWRGIDE